MRSAISTRAPRSLAISLTLLAVLVGPPEAAAKTEAGLEAVTTGQADTAIRRPLSYRRPAPPAVSPPVLDFRPLIRENWLRIFGHYPTATEAHPDAASLAPASESNWRPSGIMYRKDI